MRAIKVVERDLILDFHQKDRSTEDVASQKCNKRMEECKTKKN